MCRQMISICLQSWMTSLIRSHQNYSSSSRKVSLSRKYSKARSKRIVKKILLSREIYSKTRSSTTSERNTRTSRMMIGVIWQISWIRIARDWLIQQSLISSLRSLNITLFDCQIRLSNLLNLQVHFSKQSFFKPNIFLFSENLNIFLNKFSLIMLWLFI